MWDCAALNSAELLVITLKIGVAPARGYPFSFISILSCVAKTLLFVLKEKVIGLSNETERFEAINPAGEDQGVTPLREVGILRFPEQSQPPYRFGDLSGVVKLKITSGRAINLASYLVFGSSFPVGAGFVSLTGIIPRRSFVTIWETVKPAEDQLWLVLDLRYSRPARSILSA